MHREHSRTRIFALLLGGIALVLSGWAGADPPTRVARLGYIEAPRADEFDHRSSDRDRRGAISARYVSRDVIGYEDLDDYGTWRALR